jgi:hypothetical protein
MKQKMQVGVFALLAFGCVSGVRLIAQSPTAQIAGVITDQSGAVVPTAKVIVTNQSTGIQRQATVSSGGQYLVLSLLPGTYSITVSAPGFATKVLLGIALNVGASPRYDVKLNVGPSSQRVSVSGQSSLVHTEGATLGTVISSQMLTQLPINGRSFVATAILAPGAAGGFSNDYAVYKFGERSQYLVVEADGIRSDFTQTTIDGIIAQTNDRNWTSVLYPSPDMIQQVGVETANYASTSNGGGGVELNVATKSGTNQFHGDIFEFLQNRALNARNFFQPTNQKKPAEDYNQFGGTFGGPLPWYTGLLKNKAFIFFSYQGLRIGRPFVNLTRVPTTQELNGDFSQSLSVGQFVYDPATTVVDTSSPSGYSRTPFPGNIIPADRINPLATAISKLGFPMENNPSGFDENENFVQVGSNPETDNQWSLRLDQQIRDKDSVFGRFTEDKDTQISDGIVAGTGSDSDTNGYLGVLGWNHIYSPTLMSETRLGFTRYTTLGGSFPAGKLLVGPGTNIPLAGLDNIEPSLRTGLCCFSIDGMASIDYGQTPAYTPQNVVQLNNQHMWTHGIQTLSFGGSVSWMSEYETLVGEEIPNRVFDSDYTSTPFGYNPTQNYDTGYASFLLGLSDQISPYETLTPKRYDYFHMQLYSAYVNDELRLTPSFNMSLGLRYQYATPITEEQDQEAEFDFGTGTLVYAKGLSSLIQPYASDIPYKYATDGANQLQTTQTTNFQPHIAFAWNPRGGKTVIRTGYGMYYGSPTIANIVPASSIPPFVITGQDDTTPLYPADAFNLSAPGVSPDLPEAFDYPSLQIGEYHYKTPTMQMWNFQVQRQLTPSTVMTIAYVGNNTYHADILTRPNEPPPGPNLPSLNANRPYQGFGRIILVAYNGIGNYNGLQVNIKKNFSHGLTFVSSYAYSNALGTAEDLIDINATETEDYGYSRQRDYGPESFDFTHIFNTGFVYRLPVGRGRWLLSKPNQIINGVLGGWQLSGVVTLQTGQAYSVYGGSDLNIEDVQRPNRICNGSLSGSQRTILEDFNTSCFVDSAPFTWGNAGRDILRQRPLEDLDLGIDKSFHLPGPEGAHLQVRAEMFNTTNTPFFSIPNSGCCGILGFGAITSTDRPNRVVQVAAKIVF